MIILLTNDDGIYAPGLRALRDAFEGMGDIRIVAPIDEQSGASSAFSLTVPLRVENVSINGDAYGYGVSGKPADAVKLALRSLLPEMPGLVISGVNRGDNSGVNIIYSGTVAGAMEGALLGIPSIAVSLCEYEDPNYSFAAKFTRLLAEMMIEKGIPKRTMLNVNIPFSSENKNKGVRITRQADSHYVEEIKIRQDPRGREYYWIGGFNKQIGDGAGTDLTAVRDGYISVTPLHAQMTDLETIPLLEELDFE